LPCDEGTLPEQIKELPAFKLKGAPGESKVFRYIFDEGQQDKSDNKKELLVHKDPEVAYSLNVEPR
jgi:hypothetical protein